MGELANIDGERGPFLGGGSHSDLDPAVARTDGISDKDQISLEPVGYKFWIEWKFSGKAPGHSHGAHQLWGEQRGVLLWSGEAQRTGCSPGRLILLWLCARSSKVLNLKKKKNLAEMPTGDQGDIHREQW